MPTLRTSDKCKSALLNGVLYAGKVRIVNRRLSAPGQSSVFQLGTSQVLSKTKVQSPKAAFLVVIPNLSYRRKWYFDDLAVCALNFYTGCRESLSCFHTTHRATNPLSIDG